MSLPILRSLNIQSKLLAMLLATSIFSMLLTGYIAYTSGRDSLNQSVNNQLVGIRTAKASEIESYFTGMEQHILTLSEASMTIDSLRGFTSGVQKLTSQALNSPNVQLTPAQSQQLTQFYEKDFLPQLSKNVSGVQSAFSFIPTDVADQYLQYHYIAANPNSFAEKSKLDDAGDGSEYSRVHRIYHPRFRDVAERMGYEDIMLFDLQGNMVYAVAKQPDFTTNFRSGPYSQSNLADAFLLSLRSSDPNFVSAVDFQRYRANLGLPTSFITTTVFDYDGKFIGVLVAQINNERIDRIMTSNKNWENVGLGKTGETILFGQDYKFRSPPRLFLENPDEFYRSLQTNGYSEEEIQQIRNANSPVGIMQLLRNEATTGALALTNESGLAEVKNYKGDGTLSAYQPVSAGTFKWGLIARINENEAYSGLYRLSQRLLVTTALIAGLLTLLANYLARLFSRPIRKINRGMQQVTAGDTNVRVHLESDDEVGQLAVSFNSMVDSIDRKDQEIQQHISENERLLLNILPPSVVQRMKQGKQENIADNFPDVSVIYLEVEGFAEFSNGLSADAGVKSLNEFISALDELAEQYGVEKIKTIGASYLAVCGLSVPRIDHAKRAVDFAIASIKATQKFNRTYKSGLSLDVGIHSGAVTAGVVGKTKFIYELWGATINIARAIHESPDQNIIQVTQEVYETLRGMYSFIPAAAVSVKGKGDVAVWALKPLDSVDSALELATTER